MAAGSAHDTFLQSGRSSDRKPGFDTLQIHAAAKPDPATGARQVCLSSSLEAQLPRLNAPPRPHLRRIERVPRPRNGRTPEPRRPHWIPARNRPPAPGTHPRDHLCRSRDRRGNGAATD
nr:hypothetical protein DWF04_06015 [Cereibacter sphaeroides f. sp. denitrificans]